MWGKICTGTEKKTRNILKTVRNSDDGTLGKFCFLVLYFLMFSKTINNIPSIIRKKMNLMKHLKYFKIYQKLIQHYHFPKAK